MSNCFRCLMASFVLSALLLCESGFLIADDVSNMFRGKVFDEGGRPAEGAEVTCTQIRNQLFEQVTAVTDREGKYQLEVRGSYFDRCFIVKSKDGARLGVGKPNWRREGKRVVEVIPDLPGIDLHEPATMVLYVKDGGGKPVSDATALLEFDFMSSIQGTTDENGRVEFLYPRNAPLYAVVAVKPSVGLNFRLFDNNIDSSNENSSSDDERPVPHVQETELVLRGSRPLQFVATTEDGKPFEGYTLYLSQIRKTDTPKAWFPPLLEPFRTNSNRDGLVEFIASPFDLDATMIFSSILTSPEWMITGPLNGIDDDQMVIRPTDEEPVKLTARKMVLVGGKVMSTDGLPKAGVKICAVGNYHFTSTWRKETKSKEDGSWEMWVKPNGYYMFVLRDKEVSANAIDGIAIRTTAPSRSLDFMTSPAKRIYGKVTGPINESIQITLTQAGRLYKMLKTEEKLAPPRNAVNDLSVQFSEARQIEPDGSFEFNVGMGSYVIHAPAAEAHRFEVGEEKSSYEFIFELEQPLYVNQRITCIEKGSRAPVPFATILGLDTTKGPDFHVTGDKRGVYEGRRKDTGKPMKVIVRSPDRKLVCVDEIEVGEDDVELELTPAGTAHGRLLNPGGNGAPNAYFSLVMSASSANPTSWFEFDSNWKTADDGTFEIRGLVPGVAYRLSTAIQNNGRLEPASFLREFIADSTPLDLGDLNSNAAPNK